MPQFSSSGTESHQAATASPRVFALIIPPYQTETANSDKRAKKVSSLVVEVVSIAIPSDKADPVVAVYPPIRPEAQPSIKSYC